MFNKALFKQSSKAHFTKWLAVTIATSIIIALVLFVLGNIQIGGVSESLKQIFKTANEEKVLKENAIDSYNLYLSSVNNKHILTSLENGTITLGEDEETFKMAWDTVASHYETEIENFVEDNGREPTLEEKETLRDDLATSLISYFSLMGVNFADYGMTVSQVDTFLQCFMKAYDGNNIKYKDSQSQKEFFQAAGPILECAYIYYIEGTSFQLAMQKENATTQTSAAVALTAVRISQAAINDYQVSQGEFDISQYQTQAKECVGEILSQASSYLAPEGYTEEDVKNFQISVKVISTASISTYQVWVDEGLSQEEAKSHAAESISDQIPDDIAVILNDLGTMDLNGLIVGEMFYKVVGILLPMVFVITTANGLIAGQVDSGSMAYVLSTPTKRRTVTVTQMIYLFVSITLMFIIVSLFSIVALAIAGAKFGISYGELMLFNLGAYIVTFAVAGFCFMCSAIFNRSKNSLGLGGGVSIFFLVCTILGIFGSNSMPLAMRISAMNFFNYMSVFSLFDTGAIVVGNFSGLWKLALLAVVGIICFVIGIIKFEKKDLPL